MSRDIDRVIEGMQRRLPTVSVRQHWVKNPSVDDDGVWWFYLPGIEKTIQIESSDGMCPFMVEHDDIKSAADAETARSIEEAVEKVLDYLVSVQDEIRAGPPGRIET